jgi:hypothetical protein
MNVSVLQMGEVGLAARNPSEWSSALEVFYLDREYSRKCGSNGRRVVEANFSLQAIVPQLADIFFSTVDCTGGSS